jgi:enediyne polyketide synthase
VVGRYGLAREGLLALASGSLAEQASHMADGIPRCRGMHVDWPAWSGAGLGQRDSLAEGLAQSGATAIPVTEGARMLLKALGTPGLPARVAVHGRVGLPGPPAITAAAAGQGGHEGQTGQAATPETAKLWRGRFLERVQVHYPGVELVCDARLTLRTDPYLSDYRVDGIPVLPAAMALEAMAEVVAALVGQPMRRLTAVSMNAPVVIPAGSDDAHALVRICALRDGASVTAVLRCAESGFATDHFRATFHSAETARTLAASRAAHLPDLDEVPASDSGIVDGTELYEALCFQSGPFRRAALLPEVTSRSCRALVRGGDAAPWFGYLDGVSDASLILGSPGLADATWHVLQACVPHRRLLPSGCDAVTFSGRVADGAVEVRAVQTGAAAIRALAVPEQRSATSAARPGPEYVWDVEAVDAAGRPLVTWRGLRLADAGPLRRDAPWPPSLLSAYLERSLVALGLHPELRVILHRSQPDGADPPEGARQSEGARRSDTAVIAVVPAPSPSPDRSPGAGSHGSPATHTIHGGGPLQGLVLSVRAPGATACGWEPVVPGPTDGPEPGPGLVDIEDQLRSGWEEPTIDSDARLRAIAACLAMAGASAASPVVSNPAADGGWLLLRVARASLACTVVEISGVPCPVAIAIMTGDADRADERRSQPGRHSARPGPGETSVAGPAATRGRSTSRS